MPKNKSLKVVDWIAVVLALIGALNWGIYGIARMFGMGFDLVSWIFGYNFLSYLIYAIVGLSGVWIIVRSAMKRFMK